MGIIPHILEIGVQFYIARKEDAAINLGKYLHHTEDAPPVKSLHFPFQGLSPNHFEFLSTDIGFIFWYLKRFIYFFGYGKHLDFIGILALAQVIPTASLEFIHLLITIREYRLCRVNFSR